MDREIWRCVVAATRRIERALPRPKRTFDYSDALILRMFLWAVWHDRPLCWACDRSHYNRLFRPRQLPSVSQFCRRIASSRFQQTLKVLHHRLVHHDQRVMVRAFFDGKALPINESSKDPDARVGRGNGAFSRGYKLHALVDSSGKICDYRVTPLNEAEQPIAERLAGSLRGGTCVLADGNYDSAKLYERVRRQGCQLFTPLRRTPERAKTLAAMPPGRRMALEAWQQDPDGSKRLYKERAAVERVFAHLTNFGGGLSSLPAWARRLPRVRRWVAAKIVIYHARMEARLGLAVR